MMVPTNLEIKRPSSSNKPDDIVLVNMYERVVFDVVSDLLPFIGMCPCGKCVSDACAIILNQLEPKYVTTQQGELLSRVSEVKKEAQSDIKILATRVMYKVSQNPRH